MRFNHRNCLLMISFIWVIFFVGPIFAQDFLPLTSDGMIWSAACPEPTTVESTTIEATTFSTTTTDNPATTSTTTLSTTAEDILPRTSEGMMWSATCPGPTTIESTTILTTTFLTTTLSTKESPTTVTTGEATEPSTTDDAPSTTTDSPTTWTSSKGSTSTNSELSPSTTDNSAATSTTTITDSPTTTMAPTELPSTTPTDSDTTVGEISTTALEASTTKTSATSQVSTTKLVSTTTPQTSTIATSVAPTTPKTTTLASTIVLTTPKTTVPSTSKPTVLSSTSISKTTYAVGTTVPTTAVTMPSSTVTAHSETTEKPETSTHFVITVSPTPTTTVSTMPSSTKKATTEVSTMASSSTKKQTDGSSTLKTSTASASSTSPSMAKASTSKLDTSFETTVNFKTTPASTAKEIVLTTEIETSTTHFSTTTPSEMPSTESEPSTLLTKTTKGFETTTSSKSSEVSTTSSDTPFTTMPGSSTASTASHAIEISTIETAADADATSEVSVTISTTDWQTSIASSTTSEESTASSTATDSEASITTFTASTSEESETVSTRTSSGFSETKTTTNLESSTFPATTTTISNEFSSTVTTETTDSEATVYWSTISTFPSDQSLTSETMETEATVFVSSAITQSDEKTTEQMPMTTTQEHKGTSTETTESDTKTESDSTTIPTSSITESASVAISSTLESEEAISTTESQISEMPTESFEKTSLGFAALSSTTTIISQGSTSDSTESEAPQTTSTSSASSKEKTTKISTSGDYEKLTSTMSNMKETTTSTSTSKITDENSETTILTSPTSTSESPLLSSPEAPLKVDSFLFCGSQPCASEIGFDAKLSFGYHDRIGINCSQNACFEAKLKSLKFKRLLSNGTEEGFITVDNSTLSADNIWSIPVTSTLQNGYARSAIDSFILFVQVEDSSMKILSWNYTIKNNQAPIPGACTVSPTSFTALTNATFQCGGWSDLDGIKEYTFYRGSSSQTQIGSTTESSASFTLAEGQYSIYASATDNLAATSSLIFVQSITVSPGDIIDAIKANGTKSLSEIEAILESLFSNPPLSTKNVIQKLNPSIFDANLPKEILAFLDYVTSNKLTDAEILDALRTTIGNQLLDYTNGLSPDEITNLIKKKLSQINDQTATILGGLLTDVSKIPINSSSDFVKVLQTTSVALKNSISFTVDGTTINSGNVLYARIDNGASKLIMINGYISAANNIVYLEGDFRVSKFMESKNVDYFNVNVKINKMSADAFLTNSGTSITVEAGGYQMFPLGTNVGISMLGDTTLFFNSDEYFQQQLTAWNFTLDDSLDFYGNDQPISNATFTTFIPLASQSSFLVFQILTNSSINDFMVGKPLQIGASKLAFNIRIDYSDAEFATMEIKSGSLKLKKSNATISMWISDFEWTNSEALSQQTGYNWKRIIPESLKLENVSISFMEKLMPGTNVQIAIQGNGRLPAVLITGFEDEKELEIIDDIRRLLPSSLEIKGIWKSAKDFKASFLQGIPVDVSSGNFEFDDGKTAQFANGIIQYSGSTLFYQTSSTASVQQIDNVEWDISLINGMVRFNIERAYANKNTTNHFNTIITLTSGAEIKIAGGVLYRNSSHGYIISYGEISANGIDLKETGLSKQSLFNFETQSAMTQIMGNATDFLKTSGANMSEDDLNDAASYILGIADDISIALEVAFRNALYTSLTFEESNFNDIFNVLPLDPANIRYIEEYSSREEWAEAAVNIQQRIYAYQMIYSMNSMLSALEDTTVQKFLASGKTSGSISYSVAGTTMKIDIGKMSDLLSQPHQCNEWTVEFPPKTADLNVPTLTDANFARLSLICQDANIYLHTDNALYLVTSGYVNSTLKTLEGISIPIKDTKKPITITGPNRAENLAPTDITFKQYSDGEILDIHSFTAIQWNGTLFVEIMPDFETEDISDTMFFMSYQRLPGPLPNDHDWNITLKTKAKTHVFIDQETMINKTGIFYIGLGNYRITDENKTVSYENVTTQSVRNGTILEPTLPFSYSLKAMTKGGYYLDEEKKIFMSTGITTQMLIGDNLTQFHTHHMTVFSVGMFTSEIPSKFEYIYSTPATPRNLTVAFIFFWILIFTAGLCFCAVKSEVDQYMGRIVNLYDNDMDHSYQYVVMIDTGYDIFASTDSRVSIALYGTKDVTERRTLKGGYSLMPDRYELGFNMGRRERFLLLTDYPLGDLEYIKLSTDLSGRGWRQSWYCDQVEIKDMQTDQLYRFKVRDWFDTDIGINFPTPEEEKVIPVSGRRWPIFEAFRIHNIIENMTYMIPATGGFGRFRSYYERVSFAVHYGIFLLVGCGVACYITKEILGGQSDPKASALFRIADYRVSFIDILWGSVVGLFLSIYPMYYVLWQRNLPTEDELDDYQWQNTFTKKLYYWGNHIIAYAIFILFVTYDLFFNFKIVSYAVRVATTAPDPEINTIAKLIYIGIVFHIFFEPIKGYIISVFMLIIRQDYYILSSFEKHCLNPLPLKAFDGMEDSDKLPKLTKQQKEAMEKNEHIRCLDEKLHQFLKEVFGFLFHLGICTCLMLISKDPRSYGYQVSINKYFNTQYGAAKFRSPVPFRQINTTDDFWTWVETDLVDSLFYTYTEPAYNMRGYWKDGGSRSMGIGQIRQVRAAKNINCGIFQEFMKDFGGCIGYGHEEKRPAFSAGWKKAINVSDAAYAYTYRTEEELDGLKYHGKLHSYSGGGYAALLNGTKAELTASLAKLRKEKWIDRKTRAIFVELSAYGPAINYFVVMKLVLEYSPTGAWKPTVNNDFLRFFRYVTNKEISIAIEAVYCGVAIFILIKEIWRLITKTGTYMQSLWPWNNILIVACMNYSVICYFQRQILIDQLGETFQRTNGNVYINMEKVKDMEIAFGRCLGLTMIFTGFKIIYILRVNHRMKNVAISIGNSGGVAFAFFLFFSAYLMTFNLPLYIFVSQTHEKYQWFSTLCFTTFRNIMGDWVRSDVPDIPNVGYLVGLLYFFFTIFGGVVIIEVYIMMMMYEHAEIRNDFDYLGNEYDVLQHLALKIKIFFGVDQRKDYPNGDFPDATEECNKIPIVEEVLKKAKKLNYRLTKILRKQRTPRRYPEVNFRNVVQ